MIKSFLLQLAFLSTAAFCDENWYTIPMGSFSSITVGGPTKVIVLQPPKGNNVDVAYTTSTGATGTTSISQVNITPPIGRETEWEALLLNAISTGGAVRVSGASTSFSINSPSSVGVAPYISIVGGP